MLNILPSLSKKYALDFSLSEWKQWALDLKCPAFIGDQIYQWIFQKEVLNPSLFTNLPKAVRQQLTEDFEWDLPSIEAHLISKDISEKFLIHRIDHLLFEMVWMPYENRSTLCISSQVGCKMGCTFCQTGKMGFKKNRACRPPD